MNNSATSTAGAYDECAVRIIETFQANGETYYVTQEYRLFGFDPATGKYLVMEVGHSYAAEVSDSDLSGRVEIIRDDE